MINAARFYYDVGWNSRIAGEPYDAYASRCWRDGWRDCDEAPAEDRIPFEYETEGV